MLEEWPHKRFKHFWMLLETPKGMHCCVVRCSEERTEWGCRSVQRTDEREETAGIGLNSTLNLQLFIYALLGFSHEEVLAGLGSGLEVQSARSKGGVHKSTEVYWRNWYKRHWEGWAKGKSQSQHNRGVSPRQKGLLYWSTSRGPKGTLGVEFEIQWQWEINRMGTICRSLLPWRGRMATWRVMTGLS